MEYHRKALLIIAFTLITLSLGVLILHGGKRGFVNKTHKALVTDNYNIPAKAFFGSKFDTLCVIGAHDVRFENKLAEILRFKGYKGLMRSYASYYYNKNNRAVLFLIKNKKIEDYFYINTNFEIKNKKYNLEFGYPQACYNLDRASFYRENKENIATYSIIEIEL